MVSSKAATPEAYLAELPAERAASIGRIRDLVNASIPAGYVERMAWGMISWELPLETYPDTYNGQPLLYVALAAQKNFNALYLTCRTERLREGFAAIGKTLDMAKSCIRFKKAEDLPVDAIAEAIGSTPVDAFIARYEGARAKQAAAKGGLK